MIEWLPRLLAFVILASVGISPLLIGAHLRRRYSGRWQLTTARRPLLVAAWSALGVWATVLLQLAIGALEISSDIDFAVLPTITASTAAVSFLASLGVMLLLAAWKLFDRLVSAEAIGLRAAGRLSGSVLSFFYLLALGAFAGVFPVVSASADLSSGSAAFDTLARILAGLGAVAAMGAIGWQVTPFAKSIFTRK